ncbi:MAG: hypothetical protein CBD97_03185 [Pelagibacteraceae bacterium TMED237]|nr:MAG: hypothetical protein CBD97_03185 [Pelagibacteraceae bacterium TMED237]|tara:strand:- start:5226 stop:6185 length:960 start_codon:yes stop_codon:yes gene_type:complete
MHKLLNLFCFPLAIIGSIFLSHGLLGYNNIYQKDFSANTQTSNQINTLYSQKEITLKDPPISEVLTSKLFVKIKLKPINPKIVSEIKKNLDLNSFTNLSDSDFDDLKLSKRNFVKTVLPIIINENQNILITRNFIYDLRKKLQTFKTLNNNEVRKLNNIAEKFNIKYLNKHKLDLVDEILDNVDVIPNSIALAQAAIESGWGKSRFAQEYNALFGEYTYDQNRGVVPLEREFGHKHLIKSFASYDNSVSSYFRNINSHNAYKDFRAVRNIMRLKNNFSDINLLVNNLHSYAKDENYVKTLKAVIQKNNFDKFDLKVITY